MARDQQRIAIPRRAGDMANANIGPGAAAILDHDRLAQSLTERRGQDSGQDIGRTARWKTHGQRDGAFRKGSMGRAERQQRSGHVVADLEAIAQHHRRSGTVVEA